MELAEEEALTLIGKGDAVAEEALPPRHAAIQRMEIAHLGDNDQQKMGLRTDEEVEELLTDKLLFCRYAQGASGTVAAAEHGLAEAAFLIHEEDVDSSGHGGV